MDNVELPALLIVMRPNYIMTIPMNPKKFSKLISIVVVGRTKFRRIWDALLETSSQRIFHPFPAQGADVISNVENHFIVTLRTHNERQPIVAMFSQR